MTPTPTVTANASQVPAGRAVKGPRAPKVKLIDLLTTHAPKAEHAEHLATLCGVPDDTVFRRAVTHHAQGKRVLAPFKAKLIREGDPAVYVERKAKQAA